MEKSKNSLVLVSILMVAGLAIMIHARAATVVTATVTVRSLAVSLTPTSFDYGTMDSNTSSSTLQMFAGAGIVVTNDGSVNEDFYLTGSDTGAWTINTAVASNVYVHKFCNDTDDDCTSPPTSYTNMSTGATPLDTAIAEDGTTAFQLRITTPNPSTIFTSQEPTVTVTASASS
ncbi:MAG: hypothetical protein C3F02_01475 [Parcubacteria group bacterium]|nr:MAG: hypothetical protein C3F02_01475 [Parcubacteria group bacterium]